MRVAPHSDNGLVLVQLHQLSEEVLLCVMFDFLEMASCVVNSVGKVERDGTLGSFHGFQLPDTILCHCELCLIFREVGHSKIGGSSIGCISQKIFHSLMVKACPAVGNQDQAAPQISNGVAKIFLDVVRNATQVPLALIHSTHEIQLRDGGRCVGCHDDLQQMVRPFTVRKGDFLQNVLVHAP
jgi:hypothetical protein